MSQRMSEFMSDELSGCLDSGITRSVQRESAFLIKDLWLEKSDQT